MQSSHLNRLNQDDVFKATKTDILFTITNNIVPVIYWHKLRQKMLEFLQHDGGGRERKKSLVPATPPSTSKSLGSLLIDGDKDLKVDDSPPPSPPSRTLSDEIGGPYQELFGDFAEKTKTPEAFLNYFKMHYLSAEKFIEDFLLYLLAQEKESGILSEGPTKLYFALRTYFESDSGPPLPRDLQVEKKPSEEEKISQLQFAFKDAKPENELLQSLQLNISTFNEKQDGIERISHATTIHTEFLQLCDDRRSALDTALANQLGFQLRSNHSPPTTFATFADEHAQYLTQLVGVAEETKHTHKSFSDNHSWSKLTKIIHGKIKDQHEKHFEILLQLKNAIRKRQEPDEINLRDICDGPDQAIVDFWFPSSLAKSLPITRKGSLGLIACIEEILLLSLETSPFIEKNPLAADNFFGMALIKCNEIKNKNIKELLLKLIKRDIHSLNIGTEDISIFLQNIFTIATQICEWKRGHVDIHEQIEQIQGLFPPRNSPAALYFDDLSANIKHELENPEPSFTDNDTINDSDKKIVSFSPKTIGDNAGTDVTTKTGLTYTIKQGSRKLHKLIGSEISIANTLAEVAAAQRMQKMALAPKTIAPAYYLIKKSIPDEKKEKKPLSASEIVDQVTHGLKKHFYVASEWSTDYLSIKGCALFGFPQRKYMAGMRQPEVFEALRELNAALDLGLEDIFHAGATVVDFDKHLENFMLKFDIETLYDPSNRAYALYLVNNLKRFISENQLTHRDGKPAYVRELVKHIQKIKNLGVRVYFHNIDHDSGFYRYCDYTDRAIDLSSHRTSWLYYSRRWGLITQPTSHLTELLVGDNPNSLLLSDRSIAIMRSNATDASVTQTQEALKDYFLEIQKIAKSKILYGQRQQIRFVLLDHFNAHLTGGETIPLPASFAEKEETNLTEYNDTLEAKIAYKVKKAALQRAFDLQSQFQQIVTDALQPAQIIRMHPYNQQQQHNQRNQYVEFKSFLTRDMIDNRAELLFHCWEDISSEYKKNKRSTSGASFGLRHHMDALHLKIQQKISEKTSTSEKKQLDQKGHLEQEIKELKLQGYLATERYLQANNSRLRSRRLASTILAITGNTRKRPFFRDTSMTSVDPLNRDELLRSLLNDLEKIKVRLRPLRKKSPSTFRLVDIYHHFLNIMQTLHAINQRATPSEETEKFAHALESIYKKFQDAHNIRTTLDLVLSELIHLLNPQIKTISGDITEDLMDFINAVSQFDLVKNLKKKVYSEKIAVLNEVLPQIKSAYRNRVGFFQSTASQRLFATINGKPTADETTYAAITEYLKKDVNRDRALGQTIIDHTRWYRPADLVPYENAEFKKARR